jgi:hypothetical protein
MTHYFLGANCYKLRKREGNTDVKLLQICPVTLVRNGLGGRKNSLRSRFDNLRYTFPTFGHCNTLYAQVMKHCIVSMNY